MHYIEEHKSHDEINLQRRVSMRMMRGIDIEDVLGALGVAVVAGALYTLAIFWMLLFLGAVLIGFAGWIGLTRRRPKGVS